MTAKKQLVTQTILRKYARLIHFAKEHREALKLFERDAEVFENQITKLLLDGATVERGVYDATLLTEEGARRPAWKELYLDHMTTLHGDNRLIVEAEVVSGCQPKPKQSLVVTGPTPKV